MSTPVRRSSRARQTATTIYDVAKNAQEEKEKLLAQSKDDADDSSVEESHAEDPNDHGSESEAESKAQESDVESTDPQESTAEEESDNDEDYGRSSKVTPKKKTPSSASKAKSKNKSNRKIQVLTKPSKKRKAPIPSSNAKTAKASQKSIRGALSALSAKVLDVHELKDPTASLVSSLLHVISPKSSASASASAHTPTLSVEDAAYHLSLPPTAYTPQLRSIAKRMVDLHNSDPNAAQINLVNLLFRSVGGTVESDLNEEDVQLEELGNSDWGQIITDTVDEMRHTPDNCILFCSDPDGAVHYNAVVSAKKEVDEVNALEGEDEGGMEKKRKVFSIKDVPVSSGSLAVREYRKIYEEFWYVLGHVALVDGGMSGASSSVVPFTKDEVDDSSDSEGADGGKKKKMTDGGASQRFDTEVVRDILSRIVELVTVGQPDVRAAATTAVYSLALAILDKTTYLSDKLQLVTRQFAAAIGGKNKNRSSAKAESLRFQIDSLRRTKESLDEIVEAHVIKGVFIHRYRDSNMFIRTASIQALGNMVVRRPDMFLKDKYLKYFGWMLSDKDECVRFAALEGLNRPYEEVQQAEKNGRETSIELSNLEHVTMKFLSRIVDTVIDVHTSVQESGMKLMLSLLRAGFLDEIDDEKMWNQVNTLAFETTSTPTIRRNALYFIMEQLEEFDEGDAEEGSKKKRKSVNNLKISDRKISQRLDAIASWAAHTLTDGEIPIDKIRINLVDHLVESLRDMPEHKIIVSNWTAMIRAITDDKAAMTSEGNTAGDRADLAKQRVLVQMLACATKAEVEAVSDSDFLVSDLDPIVAAQYQEVKKNTRISTKKSTTSKGLNHEALSVALIKTLPNLLEKFKSDSRILESLTLLPRYFVPSVFSLPQRKPDFVALLKILTDIYLLSTDEQVMMNCARSIRFLSEGDHARSTEAKRGVKKLVSTIRDKVLEHLSSQQEETNDQNDKSKDARRTSSRGKSERQGTGLLVHDSDDEDMLDDASSRKIDNETSLYLNLQRARILSWQGIYSNFLNSDDDSSVEDMCNFVANGLSYRLSTFQVDSQLADDNDTADKTTDKRWDFSNDRIPCVTAGTVDEGLRFLLAVTAQKLGDTQNDEKLVLDDGIEIITNPDEEEEADEIEVDDHIVLRHRNRLLSLVDRCFQNFIDEDSGIEYTSAEKLWSTRIQESGGEIASDLRTLFPREWSNSSSSLLRSLAITDDSRLIGGYVRYLNTLQETNGDDSNISSLLLSNARAVCANWKQGNRREAGLLLSHITSSDTRAVDIVEALFNLLKAIQPVRFLEAQMASLRQSYKDWIDSEPADIDDENPTDEMMTQFEMDEVKHKETFEKIIEQANLFSTSLGGKNKKHLSDEDLSTAFRGFIKEAIRFSFSDSEEFMLGSRLSFLSIIVKYVPWVKVDPTFTKIIRDYIDEKEMELRTHEEFEDVHEDDFIALEEFRKSLGLGESKILAADASTLDGDRSLQSISTPRSAVTPNSYKNSTGNIVDEGNADEIRDTVNDLSMMTPATSAARKSHGSSVGSIRSAMSSVRSSLAPLYEEGNEDDSEESAAVESKHSRFDESLVSRQSESVLSKRSRLDESLLSDESESVGSKHSRFDESLVSRQSESVLSKRSRLDDSMLSKSSDSQSNDASPTTYSKSQSTWEGEHSDLDSPHK